MLVLGTATVLGVLGDVLLRGFPWGVNVTICVLAGLAAAAVIAARSRPRLGPEAPALALTAFLLALAFVRHASASLGLVDLIALVLVAAMALRSVAGVRLAALSLAHHGHTLAECLRSATTGGLALVFRYTPWREILGGGRAGLFRSMTLGVVLAAPILVIFGALLASADVIFATVLRRVISFHPDEAVGHVLGWSLVAFAAAGYLAALAGLAPPRPTARPRRVQTIGSTPVITALALVDLLLLVFVVVQVRYLFGGQAIVLETTGLTLAEYARGGFFELVALSAFSLPLLLAADWVIRPATPAATRAFRQLGTLTLLLLLIIVASALERMRLYMGDFGLSSLRVIASSFMLYLVLLFGWFAWTVLRGRRRRFAWGGLLLGFAVLAGLHVLNPDALVARVNVERATAGYRFDAPYVTTELSADAVPALLERLNALPALHRCDVADRLLARWTAESPDWRSWNWSRARARKLIRDRASELRGLLAAPACATRPQPTIAR